MDPLKRDEDRLALMSAHEGFRWVKKQLKSCSSASQKQRSRIKRWLKATREGFIKEGRLTDDEDSVRSEKRPNA